MRRKSKIFIAGHRGLVGSAILEQLQSKDYKNFVNKTHSELDLTNQNDVRLFFENERPEYVFLAAAKVGGILANNKYRAEFIYNNTQIQNNIIHYSYKYNVKKLVFLGSSCIYPRDCPQPIKEEYLMTNELEYTNEPYALAKISGLKMCESYNVQYDTNFVSIMPCNIYGINDNFDLENSHVLPALIRKFYLAKLYQDGKEQEIINNLKVEKFDQAEKILKKHNIFQDEIILWGSGNPKREFLHARDLATAAIFAMKNIDFSDLIEDKNKIINTHINIGSGKEITIKDLAYLIKDIVGYEGKISFDHDKPDGTMRKVLNVDKIDRLGWQAKIKLTDGIKEAFENYISK